jgi:hypothetical protein
MYAFSTPHSKPVRKLAMRAKQIIAHTGIGDPLLDGKQCDLATPQLSFHQCGPCFSKHTVAGNEDSHSRTKLFS